MSEPAERVVRVGHPDDVVPVGHAREQVVAVTVGGGRGDGGLASIQLTVAVAVPVKRDGDAGNAGLSRTLRAVGIGIEPDRVAHAVVLRGGRLIAKIGVEEHVARSQHHRRGGAVVVGPGGAEMIGIAGLGVARQRSGAGIDDHHIGSRRQIGKDAIAAGIRGRAAGRGIVNAVAVGVAEQIDRHAGHTGLAGVLPAVAVGVDPHPVAERGVAGVAVDAGFGIVVVAEIGGQVGLARSQGDGIGLGLIAEVGPRAHRIGGALGQTRGQRARADLHLISACG